MLLYKDVNTVGIPNFSERLLKPLHGRGGIAGFRE
jgi:hypothetical protein